MRETHPSWWTTTVPKAPTAPKAPPPPQSVREMGKLALFSLLARKWDEPPVNIAGLTGLVRSIQREDGSGSSFNVELLTTDNAIVRVYVRTID